MPWGQKMPQLMRRSDTCEHEFGGENLFVSLTLWRNQLTERRLKLLASLVNAKLPSSLFEPLGLGLLFLRLLRLRREPWLWLLGHDAYTR